MTPENIAIIGAVSTVVAGFGGATLGAFISYRAGTNLMKQQEFNKAITSIHAAFAPALAVIYLSRKHNHIQIDIAPPFDVDKFLKEALLGQASAIEVFRPHVPKSKRPEYQEAWEKYRYEVWDYGFLSTEFRSDVDDPGKIYEDLIHGVLQFAEMK
jgi:hypothetical protein